MHVLVPQLARGTYLRGMGFPGTPEATTAARGTPGDFTRDAQESIWTRQSWAEPSRPWRHLGPAVPLGPVSPASPPPPVNLPVALLCVLSLPVPCPLSFCLYPVRPLPLLCPLQVPLSHCPMSSGGLPLSPLMLPRPPPRAPAGVHSPCRHKSPGVGAASAESCGQAGPVNGAQMAERSCAQTQQPGVLSTWTWEAGLPLTMATGGGASGPHGPMGSPGGSTQPRWPYGLPVGQLSEEEHRWAGGL